MSTARDLKDIFAAARPLVEQWLDVAEEIAALREAATNKGLDWSQVKALVKAQVQDERDGTGEGKRVKRIIEKADFASAYADMLGLSGRPNLNENNFSAKPKTAPRESVSSPSETAENEPDHPAEEINPVSEVEQPAPDAGETNDHAVPAYPEMPDFLRRTA